MDLWELNYSSMGGLFYHCEARMANSRDFVEWYSWVLLIVHPTIASWLAAAERSERRLGLTMSWM